MAQKNHVYNTSGLWSQGQKALKPAEDTSIIHNGHEDKQTSDEDWDANLQWDSLKPMLSEEDEEEGEWDIDSELHLDSEGLHARLINWAIENGDDPQDEDWIPPTLWAKSRKQRGLKQQLKG